VAVNYRHKALDGIDIELPVGKVVCVGRNYLEHIKELNNDVPKAPLLFMKPQTALTSEANLHYQTRDLHYETEVALLIGKAMTNVVAADVWSHIWGYGLALDLTKRELQSQLKEKGHPWELAKAFDDSCPISPFIKLSGPLQDLEFSLSINGQKRQQGNTNHMMMPIPQLLEYMTKHFSLLPGDVVLTGTPQGVGQLQNGDQLALLSCGDHQLLHTCVYLS